LHYFSSLRQKDFLTMNYINLGNTGLQVSSICLGMMSYGTPAWRSWVLDEDQSRPIIQHAVEAGINFFDTADMYSNGVSEQVTGNVLRDITRREEIVVATKVYFPHSERPNMGGLSRKHIFDSIDRSLQNLGMDYVDLYQIHRFDFKTPIEETLEALHDVVKAGKARYIGASSMFAWQFLKMLYTQRENGWTRFVTMQNHYNLIYREEEREMLPLCEDQGIGVIPWSPLARGLLARPPQQRGTPRADTDTLAEMWYHQPGDDDIIARVCEVATQHDATPAQIALAWMLGKPAVHAPIIGATKTKYIDDAIGALALTLSDADVAYLEEPYTHRPVAGHGYSDDIRAAAARARAQGKQS
jgi:1-deoxyxylulose-5-phosphate synthase